MRLPVREDNMEKQKQQNKTSDINVVCSRSLKRFSLHIIKDQFVFQDILLSWFWVIYTKWN